MKEFKKDIIEKVEVFLNKLLNPSEDGKLEDLFEVWNTLDDGVQNYLLAKFMIGESLSASKKSPQLKKRELDLFLT